MDLSDEQIVELVSKGGPKACLVLADPPQQACYQPASQPTFQPQVPPQPQQAPQEPPKRCKTWLWVLGWICIFPVPLMIIMLNKEDMSKKARYGIIAAGWILYLLIGLGGGGSK